MIKSAIIIISIVLLIFFILMKITLPRVRRETGAKEWRLFGSRTHYWQTLIFVSFMVATCVLATLKWVNFF